MAFDQITFFYLYEKIKSSLIGARIDRIHSLDNAFIIRIYNGNSYSLFLSINPPFFALTDKRLEDNKKDNFAALTQKYLLQGRIEEAEIINNDRILRLTISKTDQYYIRQTNFLYYKITGRQANIILTDSNNTIIDCFFHINRPDQVPIVPGLPLHLEMLEDKTRDILALLEENKYLSNTIKKELPYTDIKSLHNKIVTSDSFYIYGNKDFHLFPSSSQDNIEKVPILSGLIDFFKVQSATQNNQKYIDIVNSKIASARHRRDSLLSEQKKLVSTERYRLIGEAIYASGLDLSASLDKISDDSDTYDLDKTLTLKENAKAAFEKYQKSKVGREKIDSMLVAVEKELALLTALPWQIENSELDDIKRLFAEYHIVSSVKRIKNNLKKEFINYNIQSSKVLVGRNNRENHLLTGKVATANDYIFHIASGSGAHVIVKDFNPQLIDIYASIAAYYSNYQQERLVTVYYAPASSVKKDKKVPGLVHFLQSKTISVTPSKCEQYLKS